MLYKPDWDIVKKRLEALWHNEIIDRPPVSVPVCEKKDELNELIKKQQDSSMEKYYYDVDYILERNIFRMENTYFGSDAIPYLGAYWGSGGHAKYLGEPPCKLAGDTVWIGADIDDYNSYSFEFSAANAHFNRESEIMGILARESKDKFLLGMPDNSGSVDALSQLRGNEPLLMDLITNPGDVRMAVDKMTDMLITSSDILFDKISCANDGGSAHWLNTWSPGKHMHLQCDFSVMISSEMFNDFVMPELEKTANWLDYSIYHLDGMEQIRHLDSILSIQKINLFQWVTVEGQPPITEFIPQLQKIQRAGKGLTLQLNKGQIDSVIPQLRPEGLLIIIGDASDRKEADEIVEYITKFYATHTT